MRQVMTLHEITSRSLTDAELDLLRRAVGNGCLRNITTEEQPHVAELTASKLIWRGRITPAGWKFLRAADRDPWLD
jgi:hypothetical protein